jgi:hypothetical protein
MSVLGSNKIMVAHSHRDGRHRHRALTWLAELNPELPRTEDQVAELENGSVLMTSRNEYGTNSGQGPRLFARSDDHVGPRGPPTGASSKASCRGATARALSSLTQRARCTSCRWSLRLFQRLATLNQSSSVLDPPCAAGLLRSPRPGALERPR